MPVADDLNVSAWLADAARSRRRTEVSVPASAIAQAWPDGVRQALLARALKHCNEVPLDGALARASCVLCGHASTADVVDVSIAVIAAARSRHGDVAIVTSDPDDLNQLINVLNAPGPYRGHFVHHTRLEVAG